MLTNDDVAGLQASLAQCLANLLQASVVVPCTGQGYTHTSSSYIPAVANPPMGTKRSALCCPLPDLLILLPPGGVAFLQNSRYKRKMSTPIINTNASILTNQIRKQLWCVLIRISMHLGAIVRTAYRSLLVQLRKCAHQPVAAGEAIWMP